MTHRWVWLLALASCDRVFGLTGRTDDAALGDAEPVDMMIDEMVTCPIPANPTGDDDHDDILNQSDLCPTTSDRGNNEDGDCEADACDLCPQLFAALDTGTPDVDGDGIGDPCDFGGTAGTVDVRRFEGFDNPDELELGGLTLDAATATLRNASPVTGFAWGNVKVPTTFQLETRFEVPLATTEWSVGLMFGATTRGTSPTGWAIGLTRISPTELRIRFFKVVVGTFMPQNNDHIVAVSDPRLRLGVRVVGRDITVSTYNGQTADVNVIEFPSSMPSGLQVETGYGVYVTGAVTAFDYLSEIHHL